MQLCFRRVYLPNLVIWNNEITPAAVNLKPEGCRITFCTYFCLEFSDVTNTTKLPFVACSSLRCLYNAVGTLVASKANILFAAFCVFGGKSLLTSLSVSFHQLI